MRKKLGSVLLSLTLVISLVACGGSGGDGTTTQKPTNDGTNAVGNEEKTLTVWCWDPAFNIYAMETAGEFYKEDNANFKLNVVETPWDDVQTKLTTAVTSNTLDTLPDIFLMQDNAFQMNVINFPSAFHDLTGSAIDYSKFADFKVAYSIVEGKNYGVPFDAGTVVTALRTDYMETAGLSVDDFTGKTWAEWMDAGEKLLEGGHAPISQTPEPDLNMMMMQSAGASLFDDEGNPTLTDNPVLKEAMEVYVELVDRKLLTIVNEWDQYVGTITNGTVAGAMNGCWILASVQTAETQSGNWVVTDMPKLEVQGGTNYSNNGGSSWAVTSASKDPELAIDFLNKTFAGSVEFYEEILPSSSAIATYLPAGDSDVYATPMEFFGGQAIYQVITEMGASVPTNNTGVYYYEARDAVGTALQNIISGGDIDTELATAQQTVEFQMGG